MSGFTKTKTFETTFDGDTVSMTLTRLKRKDMMKMAPALSKIKQNMTEEEGAEVLDEFADIVIRNTSNFSGLKDNDGNLISLEEAVEEAYFIYLTSAIATELMKISSVRTDVGEAQEGKLQQSSGESTN